METRLQDIDLEFKRMTDFICWKCGKAIDPKGLVIVDQLNGFIHEECQGEYKGE